MPAGEGTGLLELITNVVKNTKYLQSGEIEMCNENKKALREIEKETEKESYCAQEARAAVEETR